MQFVLWLEYISSVMRMFLISEFWNGKNLTQPKIFGTVVHVIDLHLLFKMCDSRYKGPNFENSDLWYMFVYACSWTLETDGF